MKNKPIDTEKYSEKSKKENYDEFFDIESVVSSTECTGLMQTPPISIDEAESYSEIYDVPHTKDIVNNHLQRE